MAGRIIVSFVSRGISRTLRPVSVTLPQALFNHNLLSPRIDRISPGLSVPDQPFCFSRIWQRQWMTAEVGQFPPISDPDVLKALRSLLAVSWLEIPGEVKDAVEAALSKKSEDITGQETLANAWRAAEAVEKFSGTLVSLRMELDELSGVGGEKVRPLPSLFVDALTAAFSRYNTYLSSFTEEEVYLKKKVEIELGSLMIHIRQRCSGLGPEWGNVSLLGTSGLSGSLIEHRAEQ